MFIFKNKRCCKKLFGSVIKQTKRHRKQKETELLVHVFFVFVILRGLAKRPSPGLPDPQPDPLKMGVPREQVIGHTNLSAAIFIEQSNETHDFKKPKNRVSAMSVVVGNQIVHGVKKAVFHQT
jgi:hypothetical protein